MIPVSPEWLRLAPIPRPLSDGEQWHVLLSYRSVNRILVLNLFDVLRQQGYEVFLDQVVLAGGDQLIKELEEGLEHSQSGVLIWSSAAADSDWVRREYETLERQVTECRSFVFAPLKLDQTRLPAFAAGRVFLDFTSYPEGPNRGELLRLLHAITGRALSAEAARFAAEQDQAAQQHANQIGAAVANRDPDQLVALFSTGGLAWETSSAPGCKAAEGLVKLGRNDAAVDMLQALEQRFPRALHPKQLHALALARRGAPGDLQQAQQALGELYVAGERDPETVGIYARTWMDRYTQSGNSTDLLRSRDLYAEAFARAADDYYTGINAEAKSVFLGDLDAARDYETRVQQIVGTQRRGGDYWLTDTIGEGISMQGQYDAAARLYKVAVRTAPTETAPHQSTWLQARRLMEKLGPSPEQRASIRAAFEHLPDPSPA